MLKKPLVPVHGLSPEPYKMMKSLEIQSVPTNFGPEFSKKPNKSKSTKNSSKFVYILAKLSRFDEIFGKKFKILILRCFEISIQNLLGHFAFEVSRQK